ncbi:MAG: ATP-binding cassette domain-containing protein [Flavobacteriales bacterium]|nr:ATP-binding cassette domain-containing protein [Flavobacteriales bacterium]
MLARSSIAMLNRQDIASPLSETMGAAVMAAIAYIGGSYVLGATPSLTGDSFLGFIIIFSQLLAPIKGFSQGYSAITRGGASGQRIFDLLAVENTVKEKPDAAPITAFNDRITYKKVSFAYDAISGDKNSSAFTTVLNEIDLEIPKGHSVALVGMSGGGHDFIVAMDGGYQTNIGDGGNRLSGGQKQRISIARAVLKNPPILILDEATSALDTESERLVQDALFKMLEGRTSLVIAHRLSTIQHCNEICVMQEGRIIERGTHKQLFEANGQYRKLCDMQAFA